ncbi:class I SAM-dependent methyltransferase, partial [Streptomyces scabiei]|uniref:class I SAM-dependent methyltransferase n=1 Tax=Streptomyces scabiei TaxID=1930 RepID=UPI0038F7BBE0
ETVQAFGRCYERTLAEWRRRFEDAWPRIRTLGFDARFRRMWNYYLAYCEVGFARGCIDVGLYRMTKPTTA